VLRREAVVRAGDFDGIDACVCPKALRLSPRDDLVVAMGDERDERRRRERAQTRERGYRVEALPYEEGRRAVTPCEVRDAARRRVEDDRAGRRALLREEDRRLVLQRYPALLRLSKRPSGSVAA
jgi:hypothetical protein